MIRATCRTLCRSLVVGLLLVATSVAASAQQRRPLADVPRVAAVTAPNGMVVAQESRAARIGAEILEKGGKAVDAAVAVGFALAVTYPRAGNIGGGGFMLIHLAASNRQVAIDYRETAPAATRIDSYLDARGEADPRKSREYGLAIGVPGTVAGLALAHRKYGSGRFRLADLILPAFKLARDGIAVDDDLADSLPFAQPQFARWPASARIFLRRDGSVLAPGDRLVQSDLAATLEAIARRGPRAFYEGPIAQRIAASVRAAGGLMTPADLKNYRVLERTPVRGRYRGHDIVSMPPSSSGGVILIEMLNMLEGDTLRAGIDPERARPSRDIALGNPAAFEGDNTTHYSIVDRFGNAVSNTYTLNLSYGVGLVAEGTGVLLNNELDDFAVKPGAPNAFGLIGLDSANAPGPGKRPLSSMTPTIVLKDGKPLLVTGSPGGSRIISTVLQVVLNVIDFGMPVADAVGAPRLHHQWLPDEVGVERGVPAAAVQALEARGHRVTVRPPGTSAHTILVTPNGRIGAADTRTRGALAIGH